MLKLIALATVQGLLLSVSQIFLKVAMTATEGSFSLRWSFLGQLFRDWRFAMSGVAVMGAAIMWMYILKHFDFSVAYPMVSIRYIFGMFAAVFIFNESIPATRWIGVALIIIGVVLIAKR